MPVKDPRKLRPVHQYVSGIDPASGIPNATTEDFDDNDIVDPKHISAVPIWDESIGYAVGDIVSFSGVNYSNINAITAPVDGAVNTFDEADWNTSFQIGLTDLPLIDSERILGFRSNTVDPITGELVASQGRPVALTAADARTILFIDQVRNTFSKFDNLRAPTAADDGDVEISGITHKGYNVGSLWVDTQNDKAYICVDNSINDSAVWVEMGSLPVSLGDSGAGIPASDGLITVADKMKLDGIEDNADKTEDFDGQTDDGNYTVPTRDGDPLATPPTTTSVKFLREDSDWVVPTDTTYDPVTLGDDTVVPIVPAADGLITVADKMKLDGIASGANAEETKDFAGQIVEGNYTVPTRDDTTPLTTTKFLREDGDWVVPEDTNTVSTVPNILIGDVVTGEFKEYVLRITDTDDVEEASWVEVHTPPTVNDSTISFKINDTVLSGSFTTNASAGVEIDLGSPTIRDWV